MHPKKTKLTQVYYIVMMLHYNESFLISKLPLEEEVGSSSHMKQILSLEDWR